MTNWKEIHPNFTPELQKEWEDREFGYEECKQWINAGLTVNDADYARWLRDIKRIYAEWLLNCGSEVDIVLDKTRSEYLREEYWEYLETVNETNKTCVDAQWWLDQNYPDRGKRNKIKELDLRHQNLKGHLNLLDFANLEELDCSRNKLNSINLRNCLNLISLDCSHNQLKDLDISRNEQLTNLACSNNQLTKLLFFKPFSSLTVVDFSNNFLRGLYT